MKFTSFQNASLQSIPATAASYAGSSGIQKVSRPDIFDTDTTIAKLLNCQIVGLNLKSVLNSHTHLE